MWNKIQKFLGGNIIKDVADVVDRFVTTKEEKENLKREMASLLHNQEMDLQRFSLEAEQEYNNRVKDLEGTAKDLLQFGWIGSVVVFVRGLQRPLWGYAVGVMDFMVFSGEWALKPESNVESAFWVINFLVLGFLFGERAVKNVAPLIANKFKK